MRKCPKGFICFENMTIVIIIVMISLGIYYLSKNHTNVTYVTNKYPTVKHIQKNNDESRIRKIPINVPTRGYPGHYSQIGIITRTNNSDTILPLYGRQVNSHKWQYYTFNDKFNQIRLPVNTKGKNCSNEYGCDELYDNDIVYVTGYNDVFKVTIYEKNNYTYIPYI